MPTRDLISSLLLAIRQMRPLSPEKLLNRLKDPEPSKAYHYLDALATLCSSASTQCSSASVAVKHDKHSNSLYIATSPGPSAPPELRTLLPAWISLIKQLRAANQSSSKTGIGSEREGSMCHYTPEQDFIVEIYRTCHSKLLAIVNGDDAGQKLLTAIEEMSPRFRKVLGLAGDGDDSLIHNARLLVRIAKEGAAEPLSSEDLLSLHRAAGFIGRFKDSHPHEPQLSTELYRISHAVDAIVEFATSSDNEAKIDLPWNAVWVDAPSAPKEFFATTNKKKLVEMVEEERRDEFLSAKWPALVPSGDVHAVEGSSDDFKGKTVIHCESILLHYISTNQMLSIDPYIGSSHPVCYACLMLVNAFNWTFDTDIEVGCRCVALRELDFTWSYPDMGEVVDRQLEQYITFDFTHLLSQER